MPERDECVRYGIQQRKRNPLSQCEHARAHITDCNLHTNDHERLRGAHQANLIHFIYLGVLSRLSNPLVLRLSMQRIDKSRYMSDQMCKYLLSN